jgi:tetratricopeptide (TPR) repeat protein
MNRPFPLSGLLSRPAGRREILEGYPMSKKKHKKKTPTKKKTRQVPSSPPAYKALPSLQSMEGFMEGFAGIGRSKRSAVDEAQQVMYEAWEAPTRQRAVALARKALTVSADCADAYNPLAEETAKSLEEAVEHYRELLRLNHNDNQGIRDLLMPCLIDLGRDEDAVRLYKQFEEDGMAVWVYSRALLDFRKHGDSQKASRSLKAALDENKHVPAYILGRKKIPRTLPSYYGFGDVSEAVLYAFGNRAAWKATPGSL